jgi:hypothetical protein
MRKRRFPLRRRSPKSSPRVRIPTATERGVHAASLFRNQQANRIAHAILTLKRSEAENM